jgi:hypothetical protein
MKNVIVPNSVPRRKGDKDWSIINGKPSSSPFFMRKLCFILQCGQMKVQFGPTLTALAEPHFECLKLNL